MKEFKRILMKAQLGDKAATEQIVNLYKGLIIKESKVNGVFDEDLMQYLYQVLLVCIRTFRM